MNYTWRILKYSKIIQNNLDTLSYCNKPLDPISQTITHSQYDTQEIHKERWLHIYSQANKLLEVSVTATSMEIRLLVHSPPNIEVTVLEHLNLNDRVAMCIKQRVLGCKFTESLRKFQITFFNTQEVNIFMDKFNEMFSIKKITKHEKEDVKEEFLKKFFKMIGEVKEVGEFKTKKSRSKIIEEFLKLVQ
ncbi:hypothetical protein NGRA_2270 [Nosema granulosis]|uniref:Uncharacterized protein n=1 Tax=Nosema granulosis TaxID=83296 RepID=A0A9P6GXH1_9MICR|nr:hypothetical protein NGRA_2270 [Nosema granulosis]